MNVCAALPQLLTTGRAVVGAMAMAFALNDQLEAAATCITLSAVVDGVYGRVARWLGATSAFGALFDYFADYLCFVVAPWCLLSALAFNDASVMQRIVLGVPLVTGAARYARNSLLVVGHVAEVRHLPGLGTVFFAFVSVTAVFLDARARIAEPWLSGILTGMILCFSILMVAPVPYPKLTLFRGVSPTVLVLLALMPFVATTMIAGTALVLGLLYTVAGPFLARRHGSAATLLPNANGDGAGR